ncbi:hypothetical protein [Paraconexibacter algicola]|uniref:Uncharacterized protein n=1 Tax=Paraconexibacter algicola TaxID=2133960 RepID=A0A2T4UD46_9ACTN|nr:hypothetical protein [Paraconexibacter algicola]PTL55405.1 hypothetical protein C7Y72_17235 [Paraconexibacter algicola]
MTTSRTRRALATTALALALLPLGATAADAKTSKAPLCENRAGTDLVAAGAYRVLRTFAPSKSDPDAGTLRVTTCRLGSRSANVIVKHASSLDSLMRINDAAFSSAKNKVALAITVESGSALSGRVAQFDLKTGKETAKAYGCDIREVWAGKSGGFAFEDGVVKIADAAGLRTAGAMGATDFALGGDTLYWTEGDATKSEKLGAAPSGTLGEIVDCG